jgi:hypothetical protein
LFLTTNRVGTIDDAFRSRLHLTLYYPDLSSKQAIKIWKKNIKRLGILNQQLEASGLPRVKIDDKKVIKWAKNNWDDLQWNGRQIRNAFQTAIALADFTARQKKSSDQISQESPEVKVSHFKIIADASEQFNQYLLDTHGMNEAELAGREKSRATKPTYSPSSKLKMFNKGEDDDEDSDETQSDNSDTDEEDSGESGSESDESDAPKKKKSSSKKETKKKSKSSKKDKEKSKE